MTIPPWLSVVLDVAIPSITGGERDRIAAAIIDALPGEAIAEAISRSVATVLRQRGLADVGIYLARECGNNAAQSVLFALSEAE